MAFADPLMNDAVINRIKLFDFADATKSRKAQAKIAKAIAILLLYPTAEINIEAGIPQSRKGVKVAAISMYDELAERLRLDCNVGIRNELMPMAKPTEKNIRPMNESATAMVLFCIGVDFIVIGLYR